MTGVRYNVKYYILLLYSKHNPDIFPNEYIPPAFSAGITFSMTINERNISVLLVIVY